MSKRVAFLMIFFAFAVIKADPEFAQSPAFPSLLMSSASNFTLNISTEELGPFYTSATETLPRHCLYFGSRYIYAAFKTFWGVELDEFEAGVQWWTGRNHVDFTEQTFLLAGAYGITEDLLIGTMLPWKKVVYDRTWKGTEDIPPGGELNENEGPGDMIVNVRYQIFKELGNLPFSLASEINIKFPTGEDRSRGDKPSLGTGKTDYKFLMMGSKNFPGGTIYCNLGYNREGRARTLDTLEYTLAFVFPNSTNWSLSGEFLGISYINWESEPYWDLINPHHLNIYNAGLGVKFRANGLVVEFGVTFPLNDDSTRTRWQPTIGINYVF